MKNNVDLLDFFKHPSSARQKQYEAMRAYFIDEMSLTEVAGNFGYKISALYAIMGDARSGKLNLFPPVTKGPIKRRTNLESQKTIIKYRKENLSSPDICEKLLSENINVSTRTIERILKDAGFDKLKRRSNKERGFTNKNKIIPNRAELLDFSKLKPFNIDCPVAGVFFFIPYILEAGLVEIVKKCNLPESGEIGAVNAALSLLLLKIIGTERLSHISSYDAEPGLGIFAGLNVLPKNTYMNTYSCLTAEAMLHNFQQELIKQFISIYPRFYSSSFINLDFHSIPHFGDFSEMEKVWCGARGKSMRGANTVFAQDGGSNAILYSRADILRKEEAKEIRKFVEYWRNLKGSLNETLVFDCKFTKYKILDELTEEGIKFITLRRRSQNLVNEVLEIPKENWKRIRLPIIKRKYKNISVYETEVRLSKCKNKFRQIIVKNHGRLNPTFIISNNKKLTLASVLEVYAKRWHIENKLSELVSFFNLNALSSPLMIRIHFDILWTIIADTLYLRFAQDLRRFEDNTVPTIFNKFINMPGRIVYDGKNFQVKIRKRGHTPILKGLEKLNKPFIVPWLDNKTIEIIWTS